MVELIAATLVVALIVPAIYLIFQTSLDLIASDSEEGDLMMKGETALRYMMGELKYCDQLSQIGSDTLKFERVCDIGGVSESRTITYEFEDGVLYRTEDTNPRHILMDEIESFQPGGLRFWCTLDDEATMYNPNLGQGATVVSNPQFTSMKFGSGFQSGQGLGSGFAQFPAQGQVSHSKGTMEFWLRPEFDSGSGGNDRHFIDSSPGLSGEKVELFYQASPRRLIFRMNGSSSTQAAWKPTWAAGELLHIGVSWDSEGVDISSDKTMALFVNGARVASDSTTWDAGSLGNYFSLGRLDGRGAKAGFDNLKIYDYCKTNFDDRFQEDARGLVSVALQLKKDDITVDLKDATRIY